MFLMSSGKYKWANDYGELSNSQKQAIITLIEKKDKREIANWRPVPLINMDAKILPGQFD